MRPNWVHGQHPPACTCVGCVRRRSSKVRGRVQGVFAKMRRAFADGKQRRERNVKRECEAYLDELCGRFGIRQALLVFDDTMQNPGACGEAGQSTIWVQRNFVLRADRRRREEVLRHELAHISLHNTPGMGDFPAHGAEFKAELARLTNG